MDYSEQVKVLLSRTNLSINFDEFLKSILKTYPQLGSIEKYEPIMEGYEDANIKLFTSTGTYVLKVFLKERDPKNIADYVKVMQDASSLGVPVAKLLEGKDGYLGYIGEQTNRTDYFITQFFEGYN